MHPTIHSDALSAGAAPRHTSVLRSSVIGSAVIGLFAMSHSAQAIGLGEIVLRSSIGETFKAEIPLKLSPGEQVDVSCIKLASQPSNDTSDVPWLSRGKLVVQQSEKGLVLVISGAPVSHPAIMLGVQMRCGVSLRRDYALLLDPPRENLAPPITSSVVAQASTENLAPGSGRSGAAESNRTNWLVEQGESLATIAQARYPDDPAKQNRFIRRAFRSGLLPSGYVSADAPLPSGSSVPIAAIEAKAIRPTVARAPAEAASPPSASRRETRRNLVPKATEKRDRLFISEGGESVLRLTTTIGERPEMPANEREKLKTELQLIAALDEKNAQHIELKERIKQLESLRARLLEEAARLETDLAVTQSQTAAVASSSVNSAPAVAESVPVTATATLPQADTATSAAASAVVDSEERPWLESIYVLVASLLALAALIAAGVVFLQHKRRGDAQDTDPVAEGVLQDPMSPPTLEGDPLMEPLSEADIWPEIPEPPSSATVKAIEGAIGPLTGAAPSSIMYAEGEDEHDSAIELADIMMSFGRMQGAAQTLSDFIRANPKQAVKPWVKLLEVYRTANMRMEFEALTAQMHKTFNVQPVLWEDFEVALHAPESLENMAHLSQRLCELWGRRECQAFLHDLLRDNRQGTRQGFPLAIVDEVLLLMAILDAQLGPYKPGHAAEAPVPAPLVDEDLPTIPQAPDTRLQPIEMKPVVPAIAKPASEPKSLDFDLIDMDMLTKTLHINLDELTEPPPPEDTAK